MSLEIDDRAETDARREIHKRGKRMVVLLIISGALYFVAEVVHRLFDLPSSVKAVSPIIALLVAFAGGDAFSLPEVWVDEFRTRMRNIDGKLTELKAMLEELNERSSGVGHGE